MSRINMRENALDELEHRAERFHRAASVARRRGRGDIAARLDAVGSHIFGLVIGTESSAAPLAVGETFRPELGVQWK